MHARTRKPGANASRHIEEPRWESGTFLRDDKPSQSHTSTGMLGKQTEWVRCGWEGRGGSGDGSHRMKKDCHFIRPVVMGFQKDADELL